MTRTDKEWMTRTNTFKDFRGLSRTFKDFQGPSRNYKNFKDFKEESKKSAMLLTSLMSFSANKDPVVKVEICFLFGFYTFIELRFSL